MTQPPQFPSSSIPFITGFAAQRSLPYAESIQFAIENGCKVFYVECASRVDSVTSFCDDKVSKLIALAASKGVSPIVHGNYRNPLSSELDLVREAAVKYAMLEIDLAQKLNAPLIVHGSGLFTHNMINEYKAGALKAYKSSVIALAEYAQHKGVEIWVENLEYYSDKHPFYTVYSKLKEYEELLDGSPDNVRMILDVGHEHISGDPIITFNKLKDRIAAVSLNDNDGVHDTHMALGKGTLDISGFLTAMSESGWKGVMAFETRGRDPKDEIAYIEEMYSFLNNEETTYAQ